MFRSIIDTWHILLGINIESIRQDWLTHTFKFILILDHAIFYKYKTDDFEETFLIDFNSISTNKMVQMLILSRRYKK